MYVASWPSWPIQAAQPRCFGASAPGTLRSCSTASTSTQSYRPASISAVAASTATLPDAQAASCRARRLAPQPGLDCGGHRAQLSLPGEQLAERVPDVDEPRVLGLQASAAPGCLQAPRQPCRRSPGPRARSSARSRSGSCRRSTRSRCPCCAPCLLSGACCRACGRGLPFRTYYNRWSDPSRDESLSARSRGRACPRVSPGLRVSGPDRGASAHTRLLAGKGGLPWAEPRCGGRPPGDSRRLAPSYARGSQPGRRRGRLMLAVAALVVVVAAVAAGAGTWYAMGRAPAAKLPAVLPSSAPASPSAPAGSVPASAPPARPGLADSGRRPLPRRGRDRGGRQPVLPGDKRPRLCRVPGHAEPG